MALQTKGLCKYCGKEYTKGGMLRHLQTCKKRSAKLAEEKGKRRCRYFQVVITGKYQKDYWLIVEASENTTLKELDAVSYTHLTLPTKRIVEISVVAG